MILVTGCPRSGTRYTAELYQELGLDLRHEHMGTDGIVAWQMGSWPWKTQPKSMLGGVPYGWRPSRVIHLLRNPLDCIASLTTVQDWTWPMAEVGLSDCRDGLIKQCARFWLRWNRLIVETWRPDERLWLDRLPVPGPNGRELERNPRPHEPIEWQDMGPFLSGDVKKLAGELGWQG